MKRAVVVLETDEARVLDAVALAGRGRKQHALRNLAVRREVHFVIRFRQQQDAARRPGRRGVGGVRQARRRQNRVQFLQRKIVVQLGQHALAKIILHARFLQFVRKQSLGVGHIRHALRLGDKRHGRRQRDAILRADFARAESDGGNVAFARGAQTQDETQRALWHAGLVGVRHDGRIEQRRRLRRILVREVGADKHLPFGRRQRLIGGSR